MLQLSPPHRPVLNRAHPMARDIAVAMPLLDGGGLEVENLAGNISRRETAVAVTWSPLTRERGPLFSGAGYIPAVFPYTNGYSTGDGFTVLLTVTSALAARKALFEIVGPGDLESGGPTLLIDDRVADLYVYVNGGYNITGDALPSGVPTRFAFVFNGTDCRLYYNAVQTGVAYSFAFWPSAYTMRINVGTGYWGRYDGNIGNVQVFNRGLTQRELLQDYADPWAIYREPRRFRGKPAAAAPTTASLQHIYRHVAGIGA